MNSQFLIMNSQFLIRKPFIPSPSGSDGLLECLRVHLKRSKNTLKIKKCQVCFFSECPANINSYQYFCGLYHVSLKPFTLATPYPQVQLIMVVKTESQPSRLRQSSRLSLYPCWNSYKNVIGLKLKNRQPAQR